MAPQTFRINKVNDVLRILDVLKIENKNQSEEYDNITLKSVYTNRAGAYEMCIKIIQEEFGLIPK